LRSAVIASLGGFLFGFDTAVISDAEATLSEIFPNKVRAREQALAVLHTGLSLLPYHGHSQSLLRFQAASFLHFMRFVWFFNYYGYCL